MQPAAILSILVQAQGLSQTQGALRALDSSARKAEGSFAGITKAATRAASVVAKVGAGGVAAGLIYSVKKAADFEAQLSSLGSVADATTKDMEALRKSALKAGADTKYSALEAAKAQTELAKGGLKTKQIIGGGLNSALALAAAGEMDLADAASTTVNAMKLFGIQGAKSMRVADAFATAANTTTADVSDFALALNQSGSAAKTVGLSFNETITALETLAEVGIKGSDAGTSLKTALIQLAAPSSAKARETAKRLGLELFTTSGKMKSLVDVSGELQDAFKGLTEKQKIQKATTLVGQDGFRALLALYDAGPKKIERLEKQLDKEGTAAEVAKKKQDNLKGSMEKLGGSAETLGINVGTLLLPAVRKGADELGKFADRLGVIASDKNLSIGEKLTKAFQLAKVTAKPWVEKIKKALDNADLPKRLGDAITAAAPVIAENAAKLGAGAVGVFVKAFNETNAWGKLLIGGVLLKKTGAGGGIIALVKKALEGSGGPLGKAGTMAKPVPVFVVNQGGGGVPIGKAAGAGVIAETVAAMGGSGGIAAAAAAAVPLTAILALALTHNQNNPTKGPGASSPSSPAGHVPLDQGAPSRRVGFNAPDVGMKDENTSAATIGAGRGRLKDEGNSAALVGAESLRKRLQEVAADITKLKDSGTSDLGKLSAAAVANFAEIRTRIGDDTAEGKRLAAKNFGALASAISSRVVSGKNSVKDGLAAIRSTLDKESGKGKDALKRNLDMTVPAVRNALGAAGRATKEGLALIRGLMVDQLKMYGFTPAQALNIAKTGDPDANKGREGGASSAIKRQRGGPIFGGAPSGDSVPAVLERGEYVLNRNAVQRVGHGNLDRLNFGHAPRFQSGGMVAAANQLDQAGFPYVWGGGHQGSPAPFGPMDCSGAVSYVLQQGGVKIPTMVSGALMNAGEPGPGAVTVFANPEHTFMRIGGRYFGTSASNPGGGAGWFPEPDPSYLARFTQRHFAAAAAAQIKRVMVGGSDSMIKGVVQGAMDATRGAANSQLNRIASTPIGAGDRGDGGEAGGSGASLMKSIAKARGWKFADWWALDAKETGHGANLSNPTSTARLRGQFLDMNYGKYGPGSDPRQNPSMAQQIQAMAAYIAERYGNPSKALAFHNAHDYYAAGGSVGAAADTKPAMDKDRRQQIATERKQQITWMQGIWAQIAPMLGQSPGTSVPSLFKHISLNRNSPFVGVAWDDETQAGTPDLLWPRWLFKNMGGQKAIDEKSKTQLFIHEMAHRFQDHDQVNTNWKSEGGAEAFARRVMDMVFKGRASSSGDPYNGFANRVEKQKGQEWIMGGQFQKPADAALKHLMDGGFISELLGSYKNGTPSVPQTGPYLLHKGEAVIPAQALKTGGSVKSAKFKGFTLDAPGGVGAAANAFTLSVQIDAIRDRARGTGGAYDDGGATGGAFGKGIPSGFTPPDPPAAGPTWEDYVDSGVARARLTPGLDDDIAAANTVVGLRKAQMDAALGDADPRNDSDAIDAYLNATQALKDLTDATEESTRTLQAAMDELKDEIKRNTDFAEGVTNTSNYQLTKTLADLVGGQIVGYGVAGRAFTPGTGVEHVY